MRNLLNFYVALATFVLLGGSALAQTATIDGVIYTVYGDSVHVTGNDGSVTEVNIPATVTINSVEYPVRVIGDRAFYSRSNITFVTLPEGLISIGRESFYDNYVLKTINLPSTVESIGHMAFGYNWVAELTELPANLKQLECAFRGCKAATFTKIPEGVTKLVDQTFYDCTLLLL